MKGVDVRSLAWGGNPGTFLPFIQSCFSNQISHKKVCLHFFIEEKLKATEDRKREVF